ncbi:hypothetical protein [Flocculibacter collagenilyticus]|uniref:hypothetical protein n=1 Tax=Flocculibacter collagenilyticus TaxID=2744479 RepID=UPI0018F4D8FE|nr:hypothetical protein [Flocculibacter collagenilyticus]
MRFKLSVNTPILALISILLLAPSLANSNTIPVNVTTPNTAVRGEGFNIDFDDSQPTGTSYELWENGSRLTGRTSSPIYRVINKAGVYTHKIRACKYGCGNFGETNTIKILPPTPKNLTASITGRDSITAKWSSTSYDDSYYISIKFGSNRWKEFGPYSSTEVTWSGLNSGLRGYRIKSCNNNVCSPYSSRILLNLDTTPPTPVSINSPSTSVRGQSFALTFDNNQPNGTSYQLWENGSYLTSNTSGTINRTITTPGVYNYKIRACRYGCGDFGNEITIIVKPDIPTNLVIKNIEGYDATLSWNSTGEDDSYFIDTRDEANTLTTYGPFIKSTATITVLTGGLYKFKVRAFNNNVSSTASTEISAEINNSEFINVLDYYDVNKGYDSMLTNALEKSHKLYFPSGVNYVFNQPISNSKDGKLHLVGDGMYNTVLRFNSIVGLDLSDTTIVKNDVLVKDLQIRTNFMDKSQYNEESIGIKIYNATSNVSFKNIALIAFGKGLDIKRLDQTSFDNILIKASEFGVYANITLSQNKLGLLHFKRLNIEQSRFAQSEYGDHAIKLTSSNNTPVGSSLILENSVIENTGGVAIWAGNITNVTLDNVHFEKNMHEDVELLTENLAVQPISLYMANSLTGSTLNLRNVYSATKDKSNCRSVVYTNENVSINARGVRIANYNKDADSELPKILHSVFSAETLNGHTKGLVTTDVKDTVIWSIPSTQCN